MDIYQDFASVYDRFMDNVPYEEWAERIDGLIRSGTWRGFWSPSATWWWTWAAAPAR